MVHAAQCSEDDIDDAATTPRLEAAKEERRLFAEADSPKARLYPRTFRKIDLDCGCLDKVCPRLNEVYALWNQERYNRALLEVRVDALERWLRESEVCPYPLSI